MPPSVKIPVPTLVKPPLPDAAPENVVFELSLPVISVFAPNRT